MHLDLKITWLSLFAALFINQPLLAQTRYFFSEDHSCTMGDLAPNFDGAPVIDTLIKWKADTVILKHQLTHGQFRHLMLFSVAGKWQVRQQDGSAELWDAGAETERGVRKFLQDSISRKHIDVLDLKRRYGATFTNYLLIVNNKVIQSLITNTELSEIPDEDMKRKAGLFAVFKIVYKNTVEQE
ncbi:hypothetical protein BC343_09595 [Mucilaginibacter pedocola]|uniref:Uncharacterized protein n=2 Tax=Mucilaginibacter pedocola TaxID=1792845 RepID=A0A1S9PD34_9SPHI|nr:hypothetical protein BC343_09595 [Mucilaginibacter pedocola]